MTPDATQRDDPPPHPGMPGWVKAALAATAVLIAILVIGSLGGVEHGPGMHGGTERAPAEGHAPPSHADHGRP